MGSINSPLWAQTAVEELFQDMPDAEVHINDIGIFSNNFQEHTQTVENMLQKLQEHNFAVKPAK